MSPENDRAIFERWPQFFLSKDLPEKSGMGVGFRCGDGWLKIIWDLFLKLESLSAQFKDASPKFEVLQVKSKFGELRMAVNHMNDAIEAAIMGARQQSIETCELCGKPGERCVDDTNWWATLCDRCRK